MKWRERLAIVSVAMLAVIALSVPPVAAQSAASSSNYSIDQVFFGTGGELNACSTSYCSKQAAGETAVGNAASAAFQTQAGFNTDRQPYLEFSVTTSPVDLGYLSTLSTATATSQFAVKTYLASGYVVTLASNPPDNGGASPHFFSAPSSPTAPASPGSVEQFGINLVANTNPASLNGPSANPVQVPDNTFSFGTVASGYNTANLYKYVKGDTIASSTKSSGETDYTISYIYNITQLTPNGNYTYNGVLVATSTF